MRNLLLGGLIALLLANANMTQAQITITIADFASIGDTVINLYDTLAPAGTTVGGTGSQTWDYSDLAFDYGDTTVYVDPASTTNGGDFTSSNIATSGDNFSAYLYADSTGILFNGIATDFFGTGTALSVLYQPTQQIIEFPATDGDSFSDTSAFEVIISGADLGIPAGFVDSVRFSRLSYYTSNIDAFGTVTTPSGTYQAIRQYTVETTTDSVFAKGPLTLGQWQLVDTAQLGGPNPAIDTSYNYHWYSNGENYPVLEMETDGPAGSVIGANFQLSSQVVSVINVDTNTTCSGICDGALEAIALSGTQPYTYLWSDPMSQTSSIATALCAGSYSVTITDGTGGTTTATSAVTEPDSLEVSLFGIPPTCDTCSDGWVSANMSGGTPNYTYIWDDPSLSTASSATNLMNGTYSVTVTDSQGCTVISDTLTITEIEHIEGALALNIYPNPTTGLLYFDLENNDVDVNILDMMGKRVHHAKLTDAATVDLSLLPDGNYFIQIWDGSSIRSKKIVLIR
ncbi:MAG: T9SS type A sorting domain-containing protein [Flavobacteriales bacterium]|nr:T9SS type A sorting domain-containing protein [Flavobacteriales bacterium]